MLDGVGAAQRPAVVGVADHSGWANFVTVGTSDRGPIVVDRRRCELIGPDVPRQPYHAAAGLDDGEAEALVARVTEDALSGARAALTALADEIGPDHSVVALCLRARGGRPLPDTVAGVLASHAAMHAAEGELYREAIGEAAGSLGIAVVLHARGDAEARAAIALGTGPDEVTSLIADFGRSVGPPWQKEHREAAAAALGELAGHIPQVGYR
jgi:hypothetical protein